MKYYNFLFRYSESAPHGASSTEVAQHLFQLCTYQTALWVEPPPQSVIPAEAGTFWQE